MMWIVLSIVIIVCIGLHLALTKKARTRLKVVEVCLLYVLVIGIGLSGLIGFIGHAFFADQIARQIGWPTGNPFQFEVAAANLAFGVLGILCIWLRGNFWYATGIGSSIFSLGAAYVHILQIIVNKNFAPYNAGFILYYDILIPVIALALLAAHKLMKRSAALAPSFGASPNAPTL